MLSLIWSITVESIAGGWILETVKNLFLFRRTNSNQNPSFFWTPNMTNKFHFVAHTLSLARLYVISFQFF